LHAFQSGHLQRKRESGWPFSRQKTVLDPLALETGRFVGAEVSADYHAIAAERLGGHSHAA
jgi:hypothetical protein